jgi:type III secretory pathway component EscS
LTRVIIHPIQSSLAVLLVWSIWALTVLIIIGALIAIAVGIEEVTNYK